MLCCLFRRKLFGIAVLELTKFPCPVTKIAREIHLKPKYTKKHVDKLISLGLLTKKDGLYQKAE